MKPLGLIKYVKKKDNKLAPKYFSVKINGNNRQKKRDKL